MMQFASRDGEDDDEAHEGDSLTRGAAAPVRTAADEESSSRESLLNALSVLFFVLLGVVVIAATFKAHNEYTQDQSRP